MTAGPATSRLQADLDWFFESLDETPRRLHGRGVWSDATGGSAWGAPPWSPAFERWLTASESSVVHEVERQPCAHPIRRPGELCPTCCAYDADGRPIAETGTRSVPSMRYRWPMRAVMARLRRSPVPEGLPDLAAVLHRLAVAGNLPDAVSVLAHRHPLMADPRIARFHVGRALRSARRTYAVNAPTIAAGAPRDDAATRGEVA